MTQEKRILPFMRWRKLAFALSALLIVASVLLPEPAGAEITAISRLRDVITFATIQPIMFVVLFAYVFGGAIEDKRNAASNHSSLGWACDVHDVNLRTTGLPSHPLRHFEPRAPCGMS